MNDELVILEDTVRASFAGVVWSHKIHEKQADIYVNNYKTLETIRIIATAITSCGVVSLVFVDELWIKLFSALISFTAVLISALFKSFSTQELSVTHKRTAISLLVIRDKYQHLLMEIRIGQKSYEELNNEYTVLENEKHQVYADSPATTDKAVEQARQALKIKNDNSYSDEETDNFLPNSLRRGGT